MIGPETGSGLVGHRLGPVDVRYMRACVRIYVRERGVLTKYPIYYGDISYNTRVGYRYLVS